MTTVNFGGTDKSTIGYTDNYVYSDGVALPSGRLAANGVDIALITSLRGYASGRLASRTISMSLGGASTSSFTAASSSSAQDTGFRSGTSWLCAGGTGRFQIDSNGSFYFGRGGSGSTYDSYALVDSGARLGGSYTYVESPTAPLNLVATAGVGQATMTWSAPASNGGSAVNGYRTQVATNSAFTTGLTTVDVGNVTSRTVTGLTPGATYWFRVAAQNAVTDAYTPVTSSVYSSSDSALIGSAPSAPGSVVLTASRGLAGVTWAKPDDGGAAIIDYKVEYGTDNTFATFTTKTVTATRTTLTQLNPAATYYVRVKARNSIGTSAASSTASGTTPARTALEGVELASVSVSGTQIELRTAGATGTPVVTLGYVAFGTGTTFVSIATVSTGTTAGTFAVPGGARNLALVAGTDGALYVIGVEGSDRTKILVKRYALTGTLTWSASGQLSQTVGANATGDDLVDVAAAFSAGSPSSILVVARRAGTIAGSLVYATVNLANVAASSGSAFIAYGASPSWLGAASAGADNLGAVDVASLGGDQVAIVADNYSVVNVIGGVVSTVSTTVPAALGDVIAPKVRILAVGAGKFATLFVSGAGNLWWRFYGTNGAFLGASNHGAANAWGGTMAARWDAYYDAVAGVVTAYYTADDSSIKLESVDVSPVTYAATAPVVLTTALGTAATVYDGVRVPRGSVDERRVVVAGAGVLTGTASLSAYSDRSGNVVPLAPALVAEPGYDATLARTFAWAFADSNPADTQLAYDLEVQRVSDSVNVVTSGKTTSPTSSRSVAGGSLANGVAYRWRVRTYDALDAVGTWSAYDSFTPSALGTLTVTNPATDNPAGLDVSTVALTWSYSQAQGYVQTSRRVRLIRVADLAVLSDTTMQASTSATYALAGVPTDVPVKVEVSIVTNAPGTPTVTTNRLLTSSYGAPMTPYATVAAGATYVELVITNPTPTGARPEVVRNVIERRPAGTALNFAAVGATDNGGTYRDHAVGAGVAYEYRVRGLTA